MRMHHLPKFEPKICDVTRPMHYHMCQYNFIYLQAERELFKRFESASLKQATEMLHEMREIFHISFVPAARRLRDRERVS